MYSILEDKTLWRKMKQRWRLRIGGGGDGDTILNKVVREYVTDNGTFEIKTYGR